MMGGSSREAASRGGEAPAPTLERGAGAGERATLGFRGGEVVMTPRGRAAKVVGCVHGPGGSRLWAEYMSEAAPPPWQECISRPPRLLQPLPPSPPPHTLPPPARRPDGELGGSH